MAKKYHLNVLISEELNDNLENTAKDMHISKSELARMILTKGVKNNRSDNVETAYDSTTINLESRVKKLEEKEESKWWKRLIR